MTVLSGMTWSHPRGYDPMVAIAKARAEKTGVETRWVKQSPCASTPDGRFIDRDTGREVCAALRAAPFRPR